MDVRIGVTYTPREIESSHDSLGTSLTSGWRGRVYADCDNETREEIWI